MKVEYEYLDKICRPKQWKTIPAKNFTDSGYPVYGANGKIGFYNEYNHEKETVLITCRGATCGTLNICEPKSYVNGNAMALNELDENRVLHKYLYYYLKFRRLDDVITGSAQPQITRQSLEKVKIPIFNINKQKEIVRNLEILDRLTEQRNYTSVILRKCLQSCYVSICGSQNISYNSWDEISIENIAIKDKGAMRTGPFGSKLKHSEFVDSGIAVLGIDNAVKNEFSWAKRRYITEEKYKELKNYTVRPEDVLVTIMGTVGRTSVVPKDIPLSINTKHLAAISCDQSKCLPEYLSKTFLFNTDVITQMKQKTKGAIMDGLNLTIIKSLKIKLPPMANQKKFVQIVEFYKNLKNKQEESSDEIEELFNSLSFKYFN